MIKWILLMPFVWLIGDLMLFDCEVISNEFECNTKNVNGDKNAR